ncbi:MAG: hypothetical protein LC791_14705 [Acidobacteria bacterium]|nr:hypothetical protein [Acidobacteriota bacterium]
MARGWESKAIESQQQDAQEVTAVRPEVTPEEREHRARRVSLELALSHAQSELRGASRPAHREMLRLKLDAIQAELAGLRSADN